MGEEGAGVGEDGLAAGTEASAADFGERGDKSALGIGHSSGRGNFCCRSSKWTSPLASAMHVSRSADNGGYPATSLASFSRPNAPWQRRKAIVSLCATSNATPSPAVAAHHLTASLGGMGAVKQSRCIICDTLSRCAHTALTPGPISLASACILLWNSCM